MRCLTILMLVLSLSACGEPTHPPLGRVTKIWVEYGPALYEWKSIDNTQDIQRVVAFIDSRRSFGLNRTTNGPSPTVRLLLYDGNISKDWFDLGGDRFS